MQYFLLIGDKHGNNIEWAHGRKHVFLSEGARQRLEAMRDRRRSGAATKVQALWRGHRSRSRGQSRPKRNEAAIKTSNVRNTNITYTRDLRSLNFLSPIENCNKPIEFLLSFLLKGTSIVGTSSAIRASQRSQRPRPQPISGTPPPSHPGQDDVDSVAADKCDFKTIQQTCALFGLDLVSFHTN